MEKPLIKNGNLTMSLEWFLALVKAVDCNSYACGGVVNHSGDTGKLAKRLLNLDVKELEKESR
jgi:hypothetical protein